jgi:hypothetical protein
LIGVDEVFEKTEHGGILEASGGIYGGLDLHRRAPHGVGLGKAAMGAAQLGMVQAKMSLDIEISWFLEALLSA